MRYKHPLPAARRRINANTHTHPNTKDSPSSLFSLFFFFSSWVLLLIPFPLKRHIKSCVLVGPTHITYYSTVCPLHPRPRDIMIAKSDLELFFFSFTRSLCRWRAGRPFSIFPPLLVSWHALFCVKTLSGTTDQDGPLIKYYTFIAQAHPVIGSSCQNFFFWGRLTRKWRFARKPYQKSALLVMLYAIVILHYATQRHYPILYHTTFRLFL